MSIHHALLARLVEIHRELVALDIAHPAIAEFLVKHAVAARIMRRGRVGGLHGIGLGLDQGRAGAGLGLIAIGLRAIGLGSFPAGAFIAGGKSRPALIVAETHRPAVKAFIDHRIDMSFRNFTEETRRQRALPGTADPTIGGKGHPHPLFGPREPDIGKPPFFLQPCQAILVHGALTGKQALLPAGQEHGVEFQSLGGMQGHQIDAVAGFSLRQFHHQAHMLQESGDIHIAPSSARIP